MGQGITTLAMYELLKLNKEAREDIKKIDSYDMNIFELREHTNENELVSILMVILAKRGVLGLKSLKADTLLSFIAVVQGGYVDISYHNKTHAADVCQTFNFYCTNTSLVQKCKMTELEVLTYCVAACCHDYQHPGVNNLYMQNSRDPVAFRYNDTSILENHHIAATFELMAQQPELNWMSDFAPEEYKSIREWMIRAVLGTDMADHFKHVNQLKADMLKENFDVGDDKYRVQFICLIFHLADISNPTKNWDVCT